MDEEVANSICVLRDMINCIENEKCRKLLIEQLRIVVDTISNHTSKLRTATQDVLLQIQYLQFDLEATRRERDELKHGD